MPPPVGLLLFLLLRPVEWLAARAFAEAAGQGLAALARLVRAAVYTGADCCGLLVVGLVAVLVFIRRRRGRRPPQIAARRASEGRRPPR